MPAVYSEKAELMLSSLVAVAWLMTILFCFFTGTLYIYFRQSSRALNTLFHIQINIIFFICLLIFFLTLVALSSTHSIKDTVLLLIWRIFDGTYERTCLLLFWAVCTIASVFFCVGVNLFCKQSTTIHRKFFHLTVSLVAVSGILYDIKLLYIAANLIFLLFIIIEVLRSLGIEPWAGIFNSWLLIFLDEAQESSVLILTHILLYIGVFLPIFFYDFDTKTNIELKVNATVLKQRFFCGVQTVGVGDSFAAIVGSWLGTDCTMKWTRFSICASKRKSIVGSVAMFVSQLVIMPVIFWFGEFPFSFFSLVLTALLSSVLEAHLNKGDNVILPFFTFLIYYLLE